MNEELAIEELKQYRYYVCRIAQLNNEIAILAQQSAPHNNLTAQMDANKGGYTPPARPDAFKVLNTVVIKKAKLQELWWRIERIEDALSVLPADQSRLLIMKYVDDWHINSIADNFSYSSRQSAYSLLKKSVTNFSQSLGENA